MTDLMSRPILRVEPTPEPRTRPVVLSAAVAAAGAAAAGVIGYVAVAVAAWFDAGTGSFGSAIRVGALGWLLANGGGLHLAGVTITAAPIGLGLVAAWMLYRGGRWAGATSAVGSLLDVAVGAAVMGCVYCLGALAAYAVTSKGGVSADLVRTAISTVGLGLGFGGLGVLRGAGLTARLLDRLPVEARAAITGAAAGVGVMLAAGTALVAASLAAHFSTAVALAEGLHAGVVGGAVMAVVGVAAVPNAVLCAGAFAAGPGFALGTGTSVTPAGVTLGALPSFPLLAAVPHRAAGWWLDALIAIPVVAGGAAGVLAVRRHPVTGLRRAALRGGVAGTLFGVAFGSLTWLATGAIGPGRMQDVGPDVAGTLLICVAAGLLGGAVSATGRQWALDAVSRRACANSAPVAETDKTVSSWRVRRRGWLP